MSQVKWLESYSGQSAEELASLENEYRIDSLVLAFEQAIQQRSARAGSPSLNDEERVVLAIEALEREINNGGYSQFFANSSQEYVPIIVDCLRRIGCFRTAEITEAAINALQLSDISPRNVEAAIAEQNPDRDQTLERCDGLYFSESEAIADQLFSYIKAKLSFFRL